MKDNIRAITKGDIRLVFLAIHPPLSYLRHSPPTSFRVYTSRLPDRIAAISGLMGELARCPCRAVSQKSAPSSNGLWNRVLSKTLCCVFATMLPALNNHGIRRCQEGNIKLVHGKVMSQVTQQT